MKKSLICFFAMLLGVAMIFSSCGVDPKKALYSEIAENYVSPTGYTTASYEAYDAAYRDARAVYENADATALEVDQALERLKKAREALVKTADFSQLKLAIDADKKISSSSYTPETYAIYEKALDEAMTVYANENAKQSEINAAVTALNNAIKQLIKLPDSTSLKQLIQEKLPKSNYTSSSYSLYETAYANAEKLVQSPTAAKSELLLAENVLRQAIAGLVEKGDVAILSAAMTKLESGTLAVDQAGRTAEQRYSAGSLAELTDLYEQARSAVQSGDISASDIDSLIRKMNEAEENLVDLSELLSRVDLLEEYSQQSIYYTEESYGALLAALANGITVVKNEAVTAQEVTDASRAIDEAIASLERRELLPDGKTDKKLSSLLIRIGNSETSAAAYMQNYAAFFSKILLENPSVPFYTEGDQAILTVGKTKVKLSEGVFRMEYTGGYPVAQEDIEAASFGGVTFDKTEFEIYENEKFGAPTAYGKRTETEFGNEKVLAVLTYEDAGAALRCVIEFNTNSNYLTYIEVSRIETGV